MLGKLKEEKEQELTRLLEKGHTAKLEEIFVEGKLVGFQIHHYDLCRQCVKEREANGEKRKV